MRPAVYLCAAALVLGVSGAATAQTSTPPPAQSPTPSLSPANDFGAAQTHWTASGFVGANLGASTSDLSIRKRRSWDFGGQVSYLWKGVVGPEFLADFTPDFGVDSVLIPENPRVNSYMANVIGVLPIGGKGRFQPFVSGGWGGIQMRFANVPGNQSDNQLSGGGNIGTGVMVFGGKIGIRGEARYYHAMKNGTPDGTLAQAATQALLSDLAFWRTNVGIAFQF